MPVRADNKKIKASGERRTETIKWAYRYKGVCTPPETLLVHRLLVINVSRPTHGRYSQRPISRDSRKGMTLRSGE
ncbi:hypothetical protein O3G_MSEX002244 [Manduca sexta]|uniref:Uncharacterized protein n=1 Tax=Manduca sexta TaxID=7130 RepID=A0A921YNG0_MANSE|nr:hypothetical protein O3G_MSEX002244 [Manduca sexta]